MAELSENLASVHQKITAACARAGRDLPSVELIAVSKTFPADDVRLAWEAGQQVFGESKVQEAEPKITLLPPSLHWHFIGRLQRNKVRKVLQHFEVVHAIDSLRLASFADEIAAELGLFPKVFLQINLGDEATKGGFAPGLLREEMDRLLALKRIEILGLMCIPPAAADAESSRPWFVALRELRDALEKEYQVRLPALSMGMSGDYEIAIEEGATHVRVGSAIFGKRSYRVDGELG
ncbi:MAG: YggS family pyridoxal phosphate-dependent enzyme [Akkermansiaceae bacterium]